MVTTQLEQVLRTDFLAFAQKCHVTVHGGEKLGDHKYLRLIARDVEKLTSKTGMRMVFNLPPGHGKTFLLSVCLPLWLIGKKRSTKGMIICYNEALAAVSTRMALKVAQSDWYRRAFSVRLDKQASNNFSTTDGGSLVALSLEAGITGRRADFIVIDDAVEIKNFNNMKQIMRVNETFDSEIQSRLNNPKKGLIIIVAHRLNEHDLCGHVLRRGWRKRVLPFAGMKRRRYDLGGGEYWERAKGELLRPDAFSAKRVAELRNQTTGPGFGPLYQQTFKGPDVLQVKRRHLAVVQPAIVPKADLAARILSIDPAQKGGPGRSHCVIQCWVVGADGKYLLLDVWREQANFSAARTACQAALYKYRPSLVLIEDSGYGPALASVIAPRDGVQVELICPTDSKQARFAKHVKIIRTGRVSLVLGGAWIGDFIDEMTSFPSGEADDQVDATTQFLEWIMNNPTPQPRPVQGDVRGCTPHGPVLTTDTATAEKSGQLVQMPRGVLLLGSRRW